MQNKHARTKMGRLEARKQELERDLAVALKKLEVMTAAVERWKGPFDLIADLLWIRFEESVEDIVDHKVGELETTVMQEIDKLEVTR